MITILHFFVDGNEFVTDATLVDCIIKKTDDLIITKLPQYGDTSTLGVCKSHGKIYQIKDTAVMLGYRSVKTADKNFILLLNNGYGILVDSVENVEEIELEDLTNAPIESELIKAVLVCGNKVLPFIQI